MTEFVEVKTAELKGAALDWAVAKATPQKHWPVIVAGKVMLDTDYDHIPYSPSSDWAKCGPLLETQYIELSIGDEEYWARRASTSKYDDERVSYPGSSMLIAACRAIVGEKLGQTVSVPKELLPC